MSTTIVGWSPRASQGVKCQCPYDCRLGFEGEPRPKLSASEVDANIDWLQEQIAATAVSRFESHLSRKTLRQCFFPAKYLLKVILSLTFWC
jgi:hypothetical protein